MFGFKSPTEQKSGSRYTLRLSRLSYNKCSETQGRAPAISCDKPRLRKWSRLYFTLMVASGLAQGTASLLPSAPGQVYFSSLDSNPISSICLIITTTIIIIRSSCQPFWRRWVSIDDLHCHCSFAKCLVPLGVSPSDVMSYFKHYEVSIALSTAADSQILMRCRNNIRY